MIASHVWDDGASRMLRIVVAAVRPRLGAGTLWLGAHALWRLGRCSDRVAPMADHIRCHAARGPVYVTWRCASARTSTPVWATLDRAHRRWTPCRFAGRVRIVP